MRVALYEALHRDDVPVEVAIDEAVELSKSTAALTPRLCQRDPGGGLAERGAVD
jgi:hypothetical protein